MPLAYLLLLFLLKVFQYERIFEGRPLLSQIGLPSFGYFSPLELLLASLVMLALILNYEQTSASDEKDPYWLPMLVYSFISASLWIIAWMIKVLFFEAPAFFNFRQVISFNPQVIFSLLTVIVLILCHYFGTQRLVQYLKDQELSLSLRILGMLIGLAVGFAVLMLLPFSISTPIAVIVMLTFILLWDIYMDNRSNNLSWTLFLLLPYSMFPGLIFIKYFQQSLIEQGLDQAGQISTTQRRQPLDLQEQTFSPVADPGNPVFDRFVIIEGNREEQLAELERWYFLQKTPEILAYKTNPNEIRLFVGRSDGQNVMLIKTLYGFIEPIAISSLFFILLLSSLFVIQFLSTLGLVKEGFTIFAVQYDSLCTRIQTGTIGTILFSFILIGVVSINFFQNLPSAQPASKQESSIYLESSNPDTLSQKVYQIDGDTTRFLRSLVAAYAFLLSIAIVLAIVITNSITQPIASIGDKLSTLSLEKNQPLEWDRQDEIGKLVETYNQMIEKIALQAGQLKKSEREEAWREMAKQVAHEIKNPLTPMKLNVQYLLRAGDQQNHEQMKALIKRVSNTLIEQIDSLSRIATEFSNFAKMPKIQLSVFSLNQLLQSIINLYKDQQTEQVSVQLDLPEEDISVKADKEQLMRVLTNLIKNGIQAIPEDRAGSIQVGLSLERDMARICVRDNGTGIPQEIRPKVFVPNFTTKSSGTGLGLAISKNIIEAVNGQIYFETKEDRGTTFYVDLPVNGRS